MNDRSLHNMRSFLYLLAEGFCIAALMVILLEHSALLNDWSKLYSTALAHRLQTDALLNGRLSLSPVPYGYIRDFIWTDHGLQQPWGLGVPLLRLPFEWLSIHMGQGPFPDRIVLMFYLVLTILIINLSLRALSAAMGISPQSIQSLLVRWYLLFWIFISPALGALIQVRINTVYHETIFYDFLFSYVLLALFWIYITRLTDAAFLALGLASGLGWLICPPLIGYGAVTLLLASYWAVRNKRGWILVFQGAGLFWIGVAVNCWCNALRFGAPFEFGHSGNLGGIPTLDYSLHFDYPFRYEPILSAARELVGIMFFHDAWRCATPRFRWGFVGANPPFSWPYLVLGLAGMVLLLLFIYKKWIRPRSSPKADSPLWNIIFLTLAWGVLNGALLFMFYARTPFINSNYLAEFSAAFNAIFIAQLMGLALMLRPRSKGMGVPALLMLGLALLFYCSNKQFFAIDNSLIQNYNKGWIRKSLLSLAAFPNGQKVIMQMTGEGIVEDESKAYVRLNPDRLLNPAVVYNIAKEDFGLIWYTLQDARFAQGHQPKVTDRQGIKKLVDEFHQNTLLRPDLPETSYCGHTYAHPGLMFQYNGWDIDTDCRVALETSAFLPSQRCVTLNYTLLSNHLFPKVQVKRNLVFLKLFRAKINAGNIQPGLPEVTGTYCSGRAMQEGVSLYSIGWLSLRQFKTVPVKALNSTYPIRLNWIKVSDGL